MSNAAAPVIAVAAGAFDAQYLDFEFSADEFVEMVCHVALERERAN